MWVCRHGFDIENETRGKSVPNPIAGFGEKISSGLRTPSAITLGWTRAEGRLGFR